MNARELAERLGALISGDPGTEILDVTHDSREAAEGTLFAAVKGLTTDAGRFVPAAMERGAAGVLSEGERPEGFEGVWLQTADTRAAMALAASLVHGEPSRKLDLVGITGTNGKTTTAYLCFGAVGASGRKGAMLTTVEYRLGGDSHPAVRTTPEATDTNRFLHRAVDAGCDFAVMESSSQALDLRRCDALEYRVAVFTNLTRDHLDYHGSMEAYFDAKKRLFDGRLGSVPDHCVVNVDDVYGARLAEDVRGLGIPLTTFGIECESDLRASDITVSLTDGTSFDLKADGARLRMNSPLIGIPHVYNILSAVGAARALDVRMGSIAEGVAGCAGAPGRFERVPNARGIAVVVDYAHTDDALENTIRTARALTKGRIVTVFGCGGDRDSTKRAPMGRVSGELSDLSILTSDNPRSEDPMRILGEIETGVMSVGGAYLIEQDRKKAIETAIGQAEEGDVVLICGKGHENYQIVGEETRHFDDREVAEEILGRV